MCDHFTVTHDRNVVGDRHDFTKFVSDQDDGFALFGKFLKNPEQFISFLRSQDPGRFVKNQDVGFSIKCLKDLNPLKKPNRKVFNEGIDIAFDESEFSTADLVLKRISDETGGVFRRATSYESLKSIYEEIDSLERSSIETRSFEIVSEWYWLPLTLALLFLCGRMILQTTWLRVAS